MDNELFSARRRRLAAAMRALTNSDSGRIVVAYLQAQLDYKLSRLIESSNEEAVAIRGELRCIKDLLSVMEQGDTPLTDSIKTQITEIA